MRNCSSTSTVSITKLMMPDSYKIEDNIYAKDTGVYGQSLFAKKDFKKDELVFVAFGSITKVPSFYTIPIAKDLNIEPREPAGNLSQYICHSCEPNLGIKNRSMFVAMCDIKKDEEVTIDYAMIVPEFPEPGQRGWEHWDFNGWDGWKCKCGREKCRGKVMGYLQLPDEEKKKYEGYVSEFILEME